MRVWIDYRVFIDVHEYHIVAAVVEFLDNCLEAVVQLCCMLILAGVEEDVEIVWDTAQMHGLPAFDAELREIGQAVGQGSVVGVVDDDIFSAEFSAWAKSEQFHEEVLVSLDVEDHTIAVCFICQEYSCAQKHK